MRCPECKALVAPDAALDRHRCVRCGWIIAVDPAIQNGPDEDDRQPDLFDKPKGRTFGPAYDPKLDAARVRKQHEAIRDYMLGLGPLTWKTLDEIAEATGYHTPSISAQLRHLRKPEFGAYQVLKRRRPSVAEQAGCWEYRVERKG